MTANSGFAGAWLRTGGANAEIGIDAAAAEVSAADVADVSRAVSEALALFALGAAPAEPNVRITDTGWTADTEAVTVTAHVGRLTVAGEFEGFRLDPVVGTSIAVEIGRRLSASIVEGSPDTTAALQESPEPVDVVTRIREHASRRPTDAAVRRGSVTYDYRTVVDAAEREAQQLDSAEAGGVVLVRFDRSIEAVVTMLGVLVSGRAYLLQSAADESEYSSAAAEFASTSVGVDGGAPNSAAYVQFTSGTTGTPKAIVVERSQLAAYCEFLGVEGICGPAVTLPVLSAPEFDAIVKQIWGQLASGGTVLLPQTDDVLREIDDATALSDVTINTVPAVWNQFLDVASHLPIQTPGTLLLGGEALDPVLVDRTRAAWPGVRIVNLYGPSETTSNATWLRTVDVARDRTPIGEPIHGSTAFVLNERLESVPVGAIGELYIAGRSVSRGYHGDTRRTADAFLPSPAARSGERMYATGDRVRQTSHGLVYLGRRDAQVKVNGVRVDLEALRADISSLAGLSASAVTIDDGSVVVVVESPDREADTTVAEHIARSWRRELHSTRVLRVERLPRTAGGKIDVAAAVGAASETKGRANDSTAAAAHRVMEIIWGNVLGTDSPSRATSLAAMGGDSMKQLKLVALYRRILEVDVSLEDFRQRDSLGDHEDLLLQRVDRDHLDRVAGSLEGATR